MGAPVFALNKNYSLPWTKNFFQLCVPKNNVYFLGWHADVVLSNFHAI